MNALRDVLVGLIASALNGFDNMMIRASDVLMGVDPIFFTVWANVETGLRAVLVPFCLVIIAICLLIELAEVASKVDIIKWEHALKIMLKMVLARVFIDVVPQFFEACYRQAGAWIGAAAGLGVGIPLGYLVNSEVPALVNSVSGLWAILGLFVSVFIVVLAIQLCGLIIAVVAYGRMFEIYVYLAVSPVPCAFFPLGDGSGGGFSRITGKFLRSFAAICLQGVMMLLCIRIFGLIMQGMITGAIAQAAADMAAGTGGTVAVSNLMYMMLLGSIALVMSVIKCSSWAKSLLDAM